MSKIREELHRLVDLLPEQQANLAKRLLQVLLEDADPEPLSAEDLAEIREAEARMANGEYVTLDELERQLDAEDTKHGAPLVQSGQLQDHFARGGRSSARVGTPNRSPG